MATTSYLNHDTISQRARTIWENQGRPEGRDLEHWLQAEAELRNDTEQTSLVAKIPLKEGTTVEAANPRSVPSKSEKTRTGEAGLAPKGGARRTAPASRRG